LANIVLFTIGVWEMSGEHPIHKSSTSGSFECARCGHKVPRALDPTLLLGCVSAGGLSRAAEQTEPKISQPGSQPDKDSTFEMKEKPARSIG
jgi:hypothetical protein